MKKKIFLIITVFLMLFSLLAGLNRSPSSHQAPAHEGHSHGHGMMEKSVTRSPAGEFVLKYNTAEFKKTTGTDVKLEEYQIKVQAADKFEAITQGAKRCFNHFFDASVHSEEEGLDIIDVCANPRFK